jgi:hypothetical protein
MSAHAPSSNIHPNSTFAERARTRKGPVGFDLRVREGFGCTASPVGILSLGCKTGQLQTILLSTIGTDDDDAAPRFCCFQTAPPSEIHLCSSLFSLAAQAVPGLNRPIPYSPGDVEHGFLWTTSSIDRTSDLQLQSVYYSSPTLDHA